MIRVLVVDDSRFVRRVLRELLEADGEIQVIDEAGDGAEAVEKCLLLAPDLVLMDIEMPVMDGLTAVRRIMQARPTPVIILSAAVNPREVRSAFQAVRAGAFEAMAKPEGLASATVCDAASSDLVARVKLYARVGRNRGWSARAIDPPAARLESYSSRVVAMGASSGGPRTVQAILNALPAEFPCPILLVQHISHGFGRGFAEWLQKETRLAVRIVERPERVTRGTVYLADDGAHLELRGGMAVVTRTAPVNASRPSVDVLFGSLARECGPGAIAVLLTGMGRDGARGAAQVKASGGDVLVQDEETSVVFGMPKAAIDLGAATRVVPAYRVPAALGELLSSSRGQGTLVREAVP